MATTIEESFLKLKQNLEITELQQSTVSTRQKNVRDALVDELEVYDSFLTGSYSRSTMIAPLANADVDIFVVLDSKYFVQDGQVSLLDKIKKVLLNTYTTPEISRNGQAVTITFKDFVVDVVPAFNRKGGGYLIPNTSTNTWISTNPKVHVDVMTSENKVHDGDLVPIVKMIKGWNRNIDYSFVSFYLELLAIQIFKGITISDFSSGMRFFFDKGREAIKLKAIDPAGYNNHVNGLRKCKTVEEAVSRFNTAYTRAVNAENYAKNGKVIDAINEWRKIFGDYFPVYG